MAFGYVPVEFDQQSLQNFTGAVPIDEGNIPRIFDFDVVVVIGIREHRSAILIEDFGRPDFAECAANTELCGALIQMS